MACELNICGMLAVLPMLLFTASVLSLPVYIISAIAVWYFMNPHLFSCTTSNNLTRRTGIFHGHSAWSL